MTETLDQIFVTLKHTLVGWVPEVLQPLVSILLSITPILMVFPLLFAVTTLMERKGLARIQNRYGPNRVGPFGLLQPIADGIKALIKEDVVPLRADRIVHFLAPVVIILPAVLVYSVLPIGRNMAAIDIDAGLLFFFSIGATAEIAIFMAGWGSRNKYSLLGAMRAIAQMISYEIPMILSALSVVLVVGSLSLVDIVNAQSATVFGICSWHVFTPWGFAAFVIFMIAANAETNRSPFDLPEAESELIAGYFTEYSGFKFALFFLGEYLGLFAISGVAITLFLGGWNPPIAALSFVPSWIWFFSKLIFFICIFIWTRGTLPRFRVDQLMNFAWKFMLPMALINFVNVALWHLIGRDGGVVATVAQWALSGGIVLAAYFGFGKLVAGRHITVRRTYRFAD